MSESLYASREQLLDPEEFRGSRLRVALGASLVFHLSLIGLIFFRQPDTNPTAAPPPKNTMVVSISATNPQRKQQPVAEDPQVTAGDIDPELADEQIENPPPADATTNEQVATVEPSTLLQEVPNPSGEVSADAEATGDQTVENPGAPVVNTEAVRNSVTAYVATYKSSLTSDWLAACLKYQNEYGVKTCPPGAESKSEATRAAAAATQKTFDTYVSGASTNARVSKQLLGEMDAMRSYLKDNSIMGELARQRYDLAQANYCALNGACRGASLTTSGSFATAVSNEGSITILVFGTDGISLFSGLMSLSFKDGLKVGNTSEPVTTFVPYRFTGTPVDESDDKDEFKLGAPLFPIRR